MSRTLGGSGWAYRYGEDWRCFSCGAEVDHYLGCPDDPNPDYEAEAELQRAGNGYSVKLESE
jgi:hypothetical protein